MRSDHMSQRAPADQSWVAALHTSEDQVGPIGTAVVIDEHRVLTSAHVLRQEGKWLPLPLWVSFPMADTTNAPRRVATDFRVAEQSNADLAVVELREPVPDGVSAAPLRIPRPNDLQNREWWAFGFPDDDPLGSAADGAVGPVLAYGGSSESRV